MAHHEAPKSHEPLPLPRIDGPPPLDRPVVFCTLEGGSLARIVEKELIAVWIIHHQQSVAPRIISDSNAFRSKFLS